MKVNFKHKWATGPNIDKLSEAIMNFYCGSKIILDVISRDKDNNPVGYSVSTGKGLTNCQVHKIGKRWVFGSV